MNKLKFLFSFNNQMANAREQTKKNTVALDINTTRCTIIAFNFVVLQAIIAFFMAIGWKTFPNM